MPRFFNTTGPCESRKHYMLPAEARLPEVAQLVEREQYFVVHAARQTGKTTAVRALAARFRAEGLVALHATLEASQGAESVDVGEARWLASIELAAEAELPPGRRPPPAPVGVAGTRLTAWLNAWIARVQPTPLVLFLDEADAVRGEPMVNLLRQLRAGFHHRPENFPASVGLVGMRDLRDYLAAGRDGTPVNPGSPFNIKAKSLSLRAVTAAHVDEAKERLVLSRTTHLHNLGERLREPRVAAIVSRVLAGAGDVPTGDDLDYCIDLGLLAPVARPARPLYREVIARQLSLRAQDNLVLPRAGWLAAGGGLDAPERVLSDGVRQLSEYLDQLGEREGWLLVFDPRPGLSWEERLWSRELEVEGRTLHLRGA